jgi:glycosyltransferase involved in cell wall biosynthesis
VTPIVHVVLPGGVDDPATPSGGNRYDRRVCDQLQKTWHVVETSAPGSWPHPADSVRAALTKALAALPDGTPVLLDGLVACAAPEALEPVAARLRLIVLVHLPLGDETGLDPAEAATLTALERRALHAASAVIATSSAAADRIRALHDLSFVHVATPGVDPAPLTEPSPDGGRLLCVAAVTPRKGQDVLVQALEQCADLLWTCVCVGALDRAPDYVDALLASPIVSMELAGADTRVTAGPRGRAAPDVGGREAAGSGGSRVEFVGTRWGAELEASYAAADLLVLPSRAETYGMVVTEALARGVPVLGTRVAGVPEALGTAPDGPAPGKLVEAGDAAALAAAIRDWLTRPELRERWREAARARRETLSGWDATARRVSEVLAR